MMKVITDAEVKDAFEKLDYAMIERRICVSEVPRVVWDSLHASDRAVTVKLPDFKPFGAGLRGRWK